MAVQIGPKIGIDGEKEYRAQIQQIIQQTKTLDSAMKATSSAWDKSTSQMTKNRAITQNLTQQIELLKQKLNIQNGMLAQSAQKFGENATQTLRWQQAVNETTASLNRMENELRSVNSSDISQLTQGLAEAGPQIEKIGQSLQRIGTTMSVAITAPLVKAGQEAIEAASNLEESSSKVDVVFGKMSESVKTFAADALESYGIAEGSALEMAGTYGSMATAMGISEKQAASMATQMVGLVADMSSFYNVSQDVAQTSLQGVFTGETEALKKFGIVMTQTNLEEFAKQYGKVYSKMSETEKVMTRFAFVLEATGDAQGDYARTADGTANSIRKFKGACTELAASLGEAILPIITPIVQALTKVAQVLAKLPDPVKKIIVIVGALVAAIGPILLIVGTLMSSIGAIITQAPVIAGALSSVIPVVLELASAFLSLTASAAPWILLALAVAAAGYAIYANWDDISAAAEDMGSRVSSAFQNLLTKISGLKDRIAEIAHNFINAFKELPHRISESLKQAIQAVKDEFKAMIEEAKKSGRDFIMGFADGIKESIQKIIDAVKDVAKIIDEYLGFSVPEKGPLSKYESWMPDFLNGLAKGIYQNEGIVTRAINSLSKSMVLPLDANASMNVALAGSGASGSAMGVIGGTTMNVYVDHISELNDLIRIQNQAQQRYRMGAR